MHSLPQDPFIYYLLYIATFAICSNLHLHYCDSRATPAKGDYVLLQRLWTDSSTVDWFQRKP